MFNDTGVVKKVYGNINQILVDPKNCTSVSVYVSAESAVEENGKKIVKAGTPLVGKLTERDKVFTVAKAGETPVGVLVHDVNVTLGENNGSLVISGLVNLARVDEETRKMFTDEMIGSFKALLFINEP